MSYAFDSGESAHFDSLSKYSEDWADPSLQSAKGGWQYLSKKGSPNNSSEDAAVDGRDAGRTSQDRYAYTADPDAPRKYGFGSDSTAELNSSLSFSTRASPTCPHCRAAHAPLSPSFIAPPRPPPPVFPLQIITPSDDLARDSRVTR